MSASLTFATLAKLPAFRPGYGYVLKGSLYLALTNKNTAEVSLHESRGPSFSMPSESGFTEILEREPAAEELADLVDQAYGVAGEGSLGGMGELDGGVCFAGAGEPLLRVDDLLEVVRSVKRRRNAIPFRINTNGLLGLDVVEKLSSSGLLHMHAEDTRRETGIDKISVFLPSNEPKSFDKLLRPYDGKSFGDACSFMSAMAETGVKVECTTVSRPGVDVTSVKNLADALGAHEFRVRSFHP